MTDKREFTRTEDEMIVANAHGQLRLDELRKMTGASQKTLSRRALELGLTLQKDRYKRVQKNRPLDDIAYCPVISVGSEDLLLKKLFDEHGERRYESGFVKNRQPTPESDDNAQRRIEHSRTE